MLAVDDSVIPGNDDRLAVHDPETAPNILGHFVDFSWPHGPVEPIVLDLDIDQALRFLWRDDFKADARQLYVRQLQ